MPGTTASNPLGSGDADFFLVVPSMNGEEGSYGRSAFGGPRPPAAGTCYPQGAMHTCAN